MGILYYNYLNYIMSFLIKKLLNFGNIASPANPPEESKVIEPLAIDQIEIPVENIAQAPLNNLDFTDASKLIISQLSSESKITDEILQNKIEILEGYAKEKQSSLNQMTMKHANDIMEGMSKINELEDTMQNSTKYVTKNLQSVRLMKSLSAQKLIELCSIVKKRNALRRKKQFIEIHLLKISQLQKDIENAVKNGCYRAILKIKEAKNYMKEVKAQNGLSNKLNCLNRCYELLEV